MNEPRKFITPKRVLFALHQDLQKVVMPHEGYSYEDLSDLEVLVILLEDRRFFQHRGIDWRSIIRELIKLVTFRAHGGASTIDMQFVRTRTGYKARTIGRKLYEMLLSFLLQYRMNKLAILRCYLGVVYLGSGLHGISAATQKVFGKNVWELDKAEAALIAAMMVYPRPLDPTPNWDMKVQRRAEYGLRLFARLGQGYKQRFE
jgi:membrane peptidoglycan carboxypeptidase